MDHARMMNWREDDPILWMETRRTGGFERISICTVVYEIRGKGHRFSKSSSMSESKTGPPTMIPVRWPHVDIQGGLLDHRGLPLPRRGPR